MLGPDLIGIGLKDCKVGLLARANRPNLIFPTHHPSRIDGDGPQTRIQTDPFIGTTEIAINGYPINPAETRVRGSNGAMGLSE